MIFSEIENHLETTLNRHSYLFQKKIKMQIQNKSIVLRSQDLCFQVNQTHRQEDREKNHRHFSQARFLCSQ